ncbi:1-aminocyclopropane-1-carboxylate deaminase/D-cysteine desulfhydrase [Algoriphagus zhangzhouensis]|uniref:1-aminocyclopropane-1-carboxylate deaminase/D-cysteine desulfhydrase, PLP-dependent ACC family n=1 Tax=Algoriphagus zhangzhouensis TaxID=1073327 RepID=A0A1M7ZKH8_9BACT|nr:pyridoxal-phosphate dependent enzyme [Algoriphagus zhangzhouensis]TDY42622.1 1-aminocyclopropane-1-carboxylate deaminase/D-cysteine desulfhydrase-like pyridoxal-dependent ACC family enzyme [Algoriphagus zhangzhouensis]SHO65403.1 1-aminocyclopropane-1-carboxylate deaminase/D-cysteine desulfhydrase, PLP-dependent ACC family [Algoriphagus zhangzhouensis]
MIQANPIVNQTLDHPILEEKGVELAIKRLDLIHPLISGNKFFKLKYNLEEAVNKGYKSILTFGGAYSNHIQASAAATKLFGLNSIGLIRGEETLPLNPTLDFAQSQGMKIEYVNRADYRRKNETEFLDELKKKYPNCFIIPEGGTNSLAIQGTAEILEDGDKDYSDIILSIGTGGTFTGILKSLQPNQKALGISSLKGSFINKEISELLEKNQILTNGEWEINTAYHFGGYAKYNQVLIDFIWEFYESFGIVLDPIYTGKMMFGIWDLIKKDQFLKGSKVLAIHTGGPQGNFGFYERTNIKLPLLSE